MIRTAFALLALATLAKNDVSGRFRLADACSGIVRAFTDNVAESALNALRPWCPFARRGMHSRCRELGRIFFAMSYGRQRRKNESPTTLPPRQIRPLPKGL